MKIKIVVALVATAAIVLISCNWFRSKKKSVSNPLVGEWTLDSIKAGRDTGVGYFLIAAAIKDSAGFDVSFSKDSIFAHSKNAFDTVGYSLDETASRLNIKDSAHQIFAYSKMNDSSITLRAKDSTIFFLHRK